MFRDVMRRAHQPAFLVLGFLLASCGRTASLPKPNTDLSEITTDYAPVVEVILPNGTGLCTGTFISPRAVLTASHCAQDSGEYMIISSFGTFMTSNKVNFGPGQVDDPNDIAVLYFDTDVASVSLGQVYGVSNQVSVGDTVRLVGFGCDNVVTKAGSSVKRTGTNVVDSIDGYLEFLTPTGFWSEKILGPDNRAGSCFGDSGGPSLEDKSGTYVIVGVTHAGGQDGNNLISEYVSLSRTDNQAFLASVNQTYNLSILGL